MSFLKSYYNSVSSYLIGDDQIEGEKPSENVENVKNENTEKVEVQESISESKSDGWLSEMYNGAYNQTGELWQAVRHDLSEFATVVSKDAKLVVAKTAEGVKSGIKALDGPTGDNSNEENPSSSGNFKNTINRLLDQVSKVLYIPVDSDDDFYRDNSNDIDINLICSQAEAKIEIIQRDSNNFQNDPTESEYDPDLGSFPDWIKKLNLDDFQSTIAELIKTNNNLFDQYASLVPRHVTHQEFWSRYFYRVATIKAEESRREIMKNKIDESMSKFNNNDWNDDEVVELADKKEATISNSKENSENDFKIKEKDDVIYVQRSLESSSTSEEALAPSEVTIQDVKKTPEPKEVKNVLEEDDVLGSGWDDDINVTEEDVELAKKYSDKDIVDDKWDDWA